MVSHETNNGGEDAGLLVYLSLFLYYKISNKINDLTHAFDLRAIHAYVLHIVL